MLKISSYYGAYLHIVSNALHACHKAGYTSYNKLYLHACLRTFYYLVHKHLISKRIELCGNISLTACSCNAYLVIHKLHHLVLQAVWSDHKCLWAFHKLAHWQRSEHLASILSNVIVWCHKAKVGIKPCGLFVVVSCTHLNSVLNAVANFSCNKTKLWMDFKSLRTIHYMTAWLLEKLWPPYIVFLVKTCPQFHKHKYILAVFCGVAQGFYHLWIFRYTIQSHFDRRNAIVLCRLVKEPDKRLYGLIRIVQKKILFVYLLYHWPWRVYHRRWLRLLLRKKKLFSVCHLVKHSEHIGHIKGSFLHKDLLFWKLQPWKQFVQHSVGYLLWKLQSNRAKAFTLVDKLRHILSEIKFRVKALVNVDIGVSCHSHKSLFFYFIALKCLVGIMENKLLYKDIAYAPLVIRKKDHTLEFLVTANYTHCDGRFWGEFCDRINTLICKKRERVSFIDNKGVKKRLDLIGIISFKKFLILFSESLYVFMYYIFKLQFLADSFVCLIFYWYKLMNTLKYCWKLFRWTHFGLVVFMIVVHKRGIIKRTHTHPKKLVKIACKYRLKKQSFKKRCSTVLSFFKNSLVKFKPW